MRFMKKIFLGIIFSLPLISSVIFAGAEECSTSNAKFQKN